MENSIEGVGRILDLFPDRYIVTQESDIIVKDTGKVLSQFVVAKYYKVGLHYNGFRKLVNVHRLVAQEHVPNPYCKPFINHLDGNKLNNYYLNLAWCTVQENKDHSISTGLENVTGENNPRATITDIQALEIYSSPLPVSKLAEIYKTDWRKVWYIKTGQTFAKVTNAPPFKPSTLTKLSDKEVIEIYNSKELNATLSEKFNVSKGNISLIRNGKSRIGITKDLFTANT